MPDKRGKRRSPVLACLLLELRQMGFVKDDCVHNVPEQLKAQANVEWIEFLGFHMKLRKCTEVVAARSLTEHGYRIYFRRH